MDPKTLLTTANDFYERGEYAQARELYREYVLLEAPDRHTLSLLSFAEQLERVDFRHRLLRSFPNSSTCRIDLITTSIDAHQCSSATLALTAEMLSEGTLDSKEERNLRLRRFCESVRRRNSKFLVEDFLFLWNASKDLSNEKGTLGLQRTLLRGLASLSHGDSIPALQEIMQNVDLPDKVKRYVQSKIEELQFLAQIV